MCVLFNAIGMSLCRSWLAALTLCSVICLHLLVAGLIWLVYKRTCKINNQFCQPDPDMDLDIDLDLDLDLELDLDLDAGLDLDVDLDPYLYPGLDF